MGPMTWMSFSLILSPWRASLPIAQFPFAQIPPIILEHFKEHLFQEAYADFLSQSDFQPFLAIYQIIMPCIRD